MRKYKYALLFKTALATFFLGLFGVFVWLSFWNVEQKPVLSDNQSKATLPEDVQEELKPETDEIMEVSFCELAKNPAPYEGQTIRLKGIYERGMHGSALGGYCNFPGTTTWAKTTPQQREEIEALTLKVYNKKSREDLEMTAVGKFERNIHFVNPNGLIISSDSIADQAQYRFELIKIEKAVRPQIK
jgi:hypothetical protein